MCLTDAGLLLELVGGVGGEGLEAVRREEELLRGRHRRRRRAAIGGSGYGNAEESAAA